MHFKLICKAINKTKVEEVEITFSLFLYRSFIIERNMLSLKYNIQELLNMSCQCEVCSNNKPFDMPVQIIKAAINNELVLFCGAGISTENKNVLPYSFYTFIKNELKIKKNLSFSELMQRYEELPNGRRLLLKHIKDRFNYIDSFPELKKRATSFHRELSEIHQIRTIITTNWDTYFEECCGAIPLTKAIDLSLVDKNSRIVLKIHGSIDNLSSIVATTNDYEKCYESLQNGAIGARLKDVLANKTVVFIGFSFGDEDFSKIIEYLRKEMGDIYPHIYIVTIDETLKEKLGYDNSTAIVTNGTFFLHQLKTILCERGEIVNCQIEHIVEMFLAKLHEMHSNISIIDLDKFPSTIYTLSYQDGMIHAFERYLQMKKTGEYNNPCYITLQARQYDDIIHECHLKGNYWDESYFEGYLNGLIFIGECDKKDIDKLIFPPLFYLPNSKIDISSIDDFYSKLTKLTNSKSKFNKYALNIVRDNYAEGLVVHHPPY